MVAEVTDQELQETEGFVADPEEITDEQVAEPTDEVDETPDPIAELREKLDQSQSRVDTLEQQLRGELGRAQRVERLFEEFRNSFPTSPASDPLTSAIADDFGALVEALASSDIWDDRSRSSLLSLKVKHDNARTERSKAALEQEILAKVQAQTNPSPQSTDDTLVAVIQQEQYQLMGYASAKGVDWTSIPQQELMFRDGETVQQAGVRLRSWIDEAAAEESAAERISSRQRAAGTGAPARAGGGSSVERDLQRLETDGIPVADSAARKRALEALGLSDM